MTNNVTEFFLTYGWAILAAVVVIGILGYYYFASNVLTPVNQTCTIEDNCTAVDKVPEFCMAAVPNYMLSCTDKNGTVMAVRADIDNIDIALSKNNCTVTAQADQIEIGYCNNMKINETLKKYKIQIENFTQ